MTGSRSDEVGQIVGTALDRHVHLMRVAGDAFLLGRAVRSHAAEAVERGCTTAIVDLSAVTRIGGPLAWELSRAHERMLWRGGRIIVVADAAELEPLFDAFALHETPDIFASLAKALTVANVSEDGVARAMERPRQPDHGPPASPPRPAVPHFAWHRERQGPSRWSFELSGGPSAPGVARAAVGRVLKERAEPAAQRDALLLVSEAVTNSVLHGGAGDAETVAIAVELTQDNLHIAVSDPVGGFEPPPYPESSLEDGGRGLPLVHALSRAWGVDGPPGGGLWFDLAS